MLEGFLDFDFGVLEGSDFLDTLELSSLVLLDSFELSANVEFLEALELFFLRNVVAGRSMVAALESALASRVFSFPAEHVSGPADATWAMSSFPALSRCPFHYQYDPVRIVIQSGTAELV